MIFEVLIFLTIVPNLTELNFSNLTQCSNIEQNFLSPFEGTPELVRCLLSLSIYKMLSSNKSRSFMLSCCVDIVECCTLCFGCHGFTSDRDSRKL